MARRISRFALQTDFAELSPRLSEIAGDYRLPGGLYSRYLVQGVRSTHLDVLIQQSDAHLLSPVIEVSERREEGSGQWRWVIRDWTRGMGDCLPVHIQMTFHSDVHGEGADQWRDGRAIVELLDPVGERVWCWSGQYFSEEIDDLWSIFLWHHKRFFPFLTEERLNQEFSDLEALPPGCTIPQANRAVSQALHRAALSSGYRRDHATGQYVLAQVS